MTDARFEAFLARVYVDAPFRERFLTDPQTEALRAGLTAEQADALAAIDREGLRLASESFANKRKRKGMAAPTGGH